MGGRSAKRSDRAKQPSGSGASATPLAKKLGIAEGDLVVMIDAPPGWAIPAPPAGVRALRRRGTLRAGDERAAVIVAFVRSAARVELVGPELADRMSETASLWIAWPRRAGGHDSDVTDQCLREILLPTGVVDVKVAALDEDWSGLKFVVRRERRSGAPARRTSSRRLRPGAAGGR
jgi:hypothetical protein